MESVLLEGDVRQVLREHLGRAANADPATIVGSTRIYKPHPGLRLEQQDPRMPQAFLSTAAEVLRKIWDSYGVAAPDQHGAEQFGATAGRVYRRLDRVGFRGVFDVIRKAYGDLYLRPDDELAFDGNTKLSFVAAVQDRMNELVLRIPRHLDDATRGALLAADTAEKAYDALAIFVRKALREERGLATD